MFKMNKSNNESQMAVQKRIILYIHTFICAVLQVSFHVIIAINLIAMVVHKDASKTRSLVLNADYGKRYDWSPMVRCYLYIGYYWGSIFSLFSAGWFIKRYGSCNLVTVSTISSSVLTATVPLLCDAGWVMFFISRCLVGFCAGFILPCFHDLASKWIPSNEKGKFISLLLSGNLGVYVVWTVSGEIIKNYGWRLAWEILPVVALIWAIIFRIQIYDSPIKHPSITNEEKEYILNNVTNAKEHKLVKIPVKLICLNCPVWSLSLLSFGNLWGLTFVSTYSPTYLAEILNEQIENAGQKSGIPFLFRFVMAAFFGFLNDCLIKYDWCKTSVKRKFFCIFSHFLPGAALIGVTLVGYNVTAVISLCIVSQALNGAVAVTSVLNVQELSQNFSGTMGGMIGGFGTLGASLSIILNGILTSHQNIMEIWHISFSVAGFVYIGTATVFVVFGSTEVQSFDRIEEENSSTSQVPK